MWQREQLTTRNKNWRKNLKKFVEKIEKMYNNKVTIILFGSRARGDYSAWSDTDLLIILEKYTIKDLEKITTTAYKEKLVSPEIHIYPLDYVKENFENNTILLDAIHEGKTLTDQLKIVKNLEKRLKKIKKKGWTKTQKGWIKKQSSRRNHITYSTQKKNK